MVIGHGWFVWDGFLVSFGVLSLAPAVLPIYSLPIHISGCSCHSLLISLCFVECQVWLSTYFTHLGLSFSFLRFFSCVINIEPAFNKTFLILYI
jgi:hypothetical protein